MTTEHWVISPPKAMNPLRPVVPLGFSIGGMLPRPANPLKISQQKGEEGRGSAGTNPTSLIHSTFCHNQ